MSATINIYQCANTGGYQVTIGDVADGEYRLAGCKFDGSSRCLVKKALTERDAKEIRRYLNRAFPRSVK